MKKLLTLLTMLCVTTVMSAATNYDLWIKGTRVTSSNASDIFGTKAASYNASTKTLTLKQAYLESSTDEVISSNIDGLTINVVGTVYLRSTNKDKCTVSLNGKTIFCGEGVGTSSLTVTRYDAAGTAGYQPIRANCDVEIKNLTMRVSNLNGGTAIRPYRTPDDATNPSAYTLSVKDADVTFVKSGNYRPIYGFKYVSLSGCSLNPMTYYKNEANSYYVADSDGNNISEDVVIKDRTYGNFGEVQIKDSNASNIKPRGLKSGSISLKSFANGGGKYILLENVNYDDASQDGLRFKKDIQSHYEVVLKGDVKIRAGIPMFIDEVPGTVYVKASSSATSTPSLTLESTYKSAAFEARCPGLVFKDINMTVTGLRAGIDGFQGFDSKDHTLTFINTYAKIKDESTEKYGAIKHFKSVSYSDCYFFNQGSYAWENTSYYNPNNKVADYVNVERGYGIYINDRNVTKDNKDDVCGDGKVSYNPSTKTLNLKGVNYKTKASTIYVFTPITINLTGANTLTTTGYVAALDIFANTTITGTQGATLAANNDIDHAGILVTQSALTIKDCEVSVYSPNGFGVQGQWSPTSTLLPGTSTLTVNNASLVINNSTKFNCIENFKSMTMTDCYYERPLTATFDSAIGYVKNGTTSVKGNLEIRKGYGVIVGGTRVTKDNASNIMSGVSYDASSKTLKFNNAKISTDTYGILAYKDLNLYISGTANSIASSKQHGILAYGDLNITGPGKSMSSMLINAYGQGCAGIYMNTSGKKLNVKNTTLSSRASNASSYGIVGTKGAATIQDAELTAYGTSASIYAFNTLTMIGVDILAPANAVFTPGTGVTLNGAIVAAKDVIIGAKEYNISVGGKKITSANCADVFGDGKVKYEPTTNTLTLNNAIIACEGYGIGAETKERLYINLIGTSYVNSLRSYALYHNNTNGITIQSTSNGTLNLSGSYIGSFQEAGNLIIKDCTVKSNGIQGKEGNNYCTLNIENANVTSECSYGGAFRWIDNIALFDSYVSEPTDAVFNTGQGAYLSGNTICSKVVIKAGTAPTAIDGITIDGNSDAPTYDLRGVQVDKNYKGIVIKNGRKYIQK